MKIQVGCLIDNSRALEKRRSEAATASYVIGVGEAVPDQHRANSLNTGWESPRKIPGPRSR